MSSLLIIAAMEKELCPVPGARGPCSGIGPVEATLTTARSLAERPASVVLNVGIAGARGLPAGTLVVGSESIYCDVMDPNSTAPRVACLTVLHRAIRSLAPALLDIARAPADALATPS